MPLLLAPVVAWLGTAFGTIGTFLLGALGHAMAWVVLWAAGFALILLDSVTGWISGLVEWVFNALMTFVSQLALWGVQTLPEADPGGVGLLDASSLSGLATWLAWANRYLPLSETVVIWALFGSVYAGFAAVKGVRLIRGGG